MTETRTDPEYVRDRVLGTIDKQTGGPQPDAVHVGSLMQILASSNVDTDVARETLGELVKEGAVVKEHPDGETYPRYRIADD